MEGFFLFYFIFFFNDTATTEIYTLSLHDALPIYRHQHVFGLGDHIGVLAVRVLADVVERRRDQFGQIGRAHV